MTLLVTTSCNEPSVIGGEVIDPDRPDVESTDTLTIIATSVRGDSVQTFDDLQLLSTYLCGNLGDPILGNSQAIINTQIRLSGTPDTSVFLGIPTGESELDSAVFVLAFDTLSYYGNDSSLQDISVFMLDEDMDNNETYFSDRDFAATELLGSVQINPRFPDRNLPITITNNGVLDTIFPAQLRVSIPKNHPLFEDYLWNENSLIYYQNDTSLLDVFKGVKIQADTTMPTDLMMAFNLRSPLSGMYLYYRSGIGTSEVDTVRYRFQINENAAQMVHFRNNTTGSFVSDFINNEGNGDSLLFMQGMAGLDSRISIPYAENLDNAIINQAQLVVTVATKLMDDEDVFHDDPIQQLLIVAKSADGELEFISDVDASILAQNIPGVFGGDVKSVTKNGVSIRQYKMNITDHFQDMVDGITPSNDIFITAVPKGQSANRSIIFGPGHSTYPVKLNITYTINQ